MPELPEVEVVKRALTVIFNAHSEIEKVVWRRPDLRFPLPLKLLKKWKKVTVGPIERRAKYLLLHSAAGSLVCHLGMTGNFRLRESPDDVRTHDHVEFWFANGAVLVFEDPRRFGFFQEWPGDWNQVTREALGFEPLEPAWTAAVLKSQVKNRKTPIKTFLMDQRIVVGIGNIYASEILFRAGVRPSRPAHKVSRLECDKIVQISREVLLAAIRHGGSSIRDFYSPDQGQGNFQTSHLVYNREKQACVICETPIRKTVQGGRSTFWCPRCQT